MARDVDLFATFLGSQGERQRILIRFRPHGGYGEGLCDLDYLGEISFVHGDLAGGSTGPSGRSSEDNSVSEWVTRLKQRILGDS